MEQLDIVGLIVILGAKEKELGRKIFRNDGQVLPPPPTTCRERHKFTNLRSSANPR